MFLTQFFLVPFASVVYAQSSSATSSAATAAVTAAVSTTSASSSLSGTNVCTTTAGGSIQIITPLNGTIESSSSNMTITWNLLGSDTTFNAASISFGDATNPNSATPISNSYIVKNVKVTAGTASGPIPSSLSANIPYGVRSEYLDGTTWRYCFSPSFYVTSSSSSSSSGSSGSSGLTTTITSTVTINKSSAEKVFAAVSVLVSVIAFV
ncbi:hypothetical protein HK100_000189 [Physocladia obscura]|uniref:Uncharacterized protein n=1 Tax=Physocladia obscura TaxID=109957 RepID=A0AAD5T1J2_9FUNG|nr:hypothetical protein HK100_000189 [Physocladia obscura]